MPFCDAVALSDYWADYPPLHMMIREYVGYEGTGKVRRPQNPMEVAEAMHAITGSGRAPKVATAPARDREIFAALKEQAKKGKEK